jgi:hypothetical protein
MNSVAISAVLEKTPPKMAQGLANKSVKLWLNTFLPQYARVSICIAPLLVMKMRRIPVIKMD